MPPVLQIEKLTKIYRLGELDRSVFFRDWRRKFSGDLAEISEDDPNLYWALRDVSFDIQEGEVLGLLGRNGAGKSTLLKVLAQITAPTRGCVRLRGRVASLLEVGTGFHLEMSGRDNVYLNGTILGMTHREVRSKFDEIVAFSGVEEFIDTPVKHYSVGMRVRLAFAVAAHLEPEILLVDEVLSVGDAEFQKKCLGKIGEVSRSGRTVLLVSHNSASIEALCTRGVLLERGRLVFDGTPGAALDALAATRSALTSQLRERTDRSGTGEVRVTALRLENGRGAALAAARSGQPLDIVLEYERRPGVSFPRLSAQVMIQSHVGAPLFTQANWLTGESFGELPERGSLICRIPALPLIAGQFQLGFRIMSEMRANAPLLDALENAAELPVDAGDFFGSGRLPGPKGGAVLVAGEWRAEASRVS